MKFKSLLELRVTILALLLMGVGVAGFGLRSIADAQVVSNLFRGGGHAGALREPAFKFRTVKKNRGVVNTERNLLVVPDYYGEPFAVTTTDRSSVIWYRSTDGTARNVIIQRNDVLVETRYQPSKRETR